MIYGDTSGIVRPATNNYGGIEGLRGSNSHSQRSQVEPAAYDDLGAAMIFKNYSNLPISEYDTGAISHVQSMNTTIAPQ